jgi:hypothetical protein
LLIFEGYMVTVSRCLNDIFGLVVLVSIIYVKSPYFGDSVDGWSCFWNGCDSGWFYGEIFFSSSMFC